MWILNSKIFTGLISALSVWVLFSVISAEVEKDEVKKEVAAVENKITAVRQNNEILEKYIQSIKNPDFLEKEARLRLNYKAPGEEVVFVHREMNAKAASSGEEPPLDDVPSYKKLLHWLLGN